MTGVWVRIERSDRGISSQSLIALLYRIVEYATREQAQQAVAQLSNQNLMGRLVYVREVGATPYI